MNNFSKSLRCLAYIVLFFCGTQIIHAQTAMDYYFSQTNGTYTAITGGSQAQAAGVDDDVSATLNIGFTFNFAGVDYTQFSTCSNGWIHLGPATTSTSSTALTSTTAALHPIIAFMARDGKTGGAVTYETSGTAPNRVLTVQYATYYPAYSSTANYMDVQVKLYETTNAVQIVYGSSTLTSAYTGQVGISSAVGVVNTRTTTSDWSASTQGLTSAATMTLSSTVKPASGLTYTWTPATCLVPSVAAASHTLTTADFNITAPSVVPALGYEYIYSTSNVVPEYTATGTTVTGPSINLTGLTPNSTYYVSVRSVCSSSEASVWSLPVAVYTGYCIPTGSSSYYLSAIRTNGASSDINFTANTAQGYRDNSSTQLITYPGNQFTYTLTPNIGTSYYYIWIDWNNDLDFTDAGETIISITSYTASYSGTFTIPSTQPAGSYRMRVANSFSGTITSSCGPAGSGGFVDFTLVVAARPTCEIPTNLVATTTTSTTASINWVAPATVPADGYEYYYSTTNTPPTATTVGTAVTTNTATLTNLTPNTTYYVWVRSVCSSTDVSFWTNSASFYTGYCIPTGSNSYYVAGFTTVGASGNISFTATTPQAYRDNSSTQITSYPGNQFTYTITPSTGTNYYYVWIDWNNDLDFTDAGEQIVATTSYASNYTGTITIPTTQAAGSYTIRVANSFSGTVSSSCGPATNGSFVDFTIVVGAPPSCILPINVVATPSSTTTATITWDVPVVVPADGYEYYYSTTNTAPTATTTGTIVTTNTANLTNLTPNTTYYVWVRSVCSSTEFSSWTNATSFYTGYCVPTGSNTYYISGFTTVGAAGNISFTASTPQAYRDNSTTQINTYPGNQFTYTITPSTGTNYYYVWIDWNNDMDFNDAGEQIVATTSYTSNYTGTITIPTTQAAGSYRIRIANSFSGTVTSACGPAGSGGFVDFTLVVSAPPTCTVLANVVARATSTTTATITWDAPATVPANGYEYYYSTTNTTPTATAVGTTVTTNSATLTNLTPNTTYYVWVRSLCSATDIGYWSPVTSFYSGYCVPTGSTTYYLSSISTANATTNLAFTNTTSAIYLDRSTMQFESYPGNQFTVSITPSGSASQIYYMWVDWNNDLDFDDAGEAIFATTSGTTSYTGTVTVPATQALGSYRVRIAMATVNGTIPVSPCASTYGRYADFTMVIAATPTCSTPSNLTYSNLLTTSVDVSWDAPAVVPADGYEYYISTTNTRPSATTPGMSVSTNSVTINGLVENNTYYVWVRSICSSTDASSWTNPITFFTNYCTPVGSSSYYITSFVTTNAISDLNYTSATAQGYINNRSMTLVGYPGNVISYNMIGNGSDYHYIWIDWNNDMDFNDPGETVLATASYAASAAGNITIPAGQAYGNYTMRISSSYIGANTPCGPASYGNYIDFTVVVGAIPTCFTPTSLTATMTSASSAIISWDAPSTIPAGGYEYYISTVTTNPSATTTGTLTNNLSATLTNLVPNTVYYVWVRAICSTTDQSYWSSRAQFYTGPCVPTGTTGYYVTNFTTTNADANINYTATSGQGYVNSTSLVISSHTGNVVNFTMTANNTSNNFYVWIDWNNDMDFNDAGETILATTGYAASGAGSFTVPANQPAGNYNVRVSTSWLGANTPCGPAGYGNYVDFLLYVRPNCVDSISLTSSIVNVCSGVLGSATIIPSTPNNTTTNFFYEWSNGQTTATATGLTMGYYYVTVTDGDQCSSSDSLIITSSIVATATEQLQGDCGAENGSGRVVVAGSNTPDISYIWNTGATTDVINNLAEGVYTVTVTDQICTKVTDLYIYHTDDFAITAEVTPVSNTNGTLGSIEITSPTNGTYEWSTGETTALITGLQTGAYTVTVTDIDGCFKVETFEVSIMTGVDNIDLSVVKAYPNPTTSLVNIAGLPMDSKVMVVNNLGQIVRSFVAQNEIEQVDLSDLAPATYWIRIENENASTILPIIRMK